MLAHCLLKGTAPRCASFRPARAPAARVLTLRCQGGLQSQHGEAPIHTECSTSEARCQLTAAGAVLAVAACSSLISPGAAEALVIHAEPANALSLPTWAIHVSSVVEWVTAMGLMWKYAEASGNERFKGMAWGMVPSLGSAMAACTWHFFYNSPDLEFLVVVQAALTVLGNCTCWWAAYRIYEAAMAEKSSA